MAVFDHPGHELFVWNGWPWCWFNLDCYFCCLDRMTLGSIESEDQLLKYQLCRSRWLNYRKSQNWMICTSCLYCWKQIYTFGGWGSIRGHDNVHDDMNMYVIMDDQCLFIAMINSFHTWSIAFHSMNSTFMHESVWSMIITINVHSLGYDHWS